MANFSLGNVHLALGQSFDIALQVRNNQNKFDNITVILDGYNISYMLNTTQGNITDSGRKLVTIMKPNESKTFMVRILSSTVRSAPYQLNLTAKSDLDLITVYSDTVNVHMKYPPSFTGLEAWAIAILVTVSVAIYFVMNPNAIKKK
jgi:hypothetical protein